MSKASLKAVELHSQGYNCAQSVIGSLCREKEFSILTKIGSSFGGGVGGQGQICGAVSALAILLGAYSGYDTPEKGQPKKDHTALVANACKQFSDISGSIVCSDLVEKPGDKISKIPDGLTCDELIGLAAEIGERMLKV